MLFTLKTTAKQSILLLLFAILALLANNKCQTSVEAAARLIRIPLQRATTQSAGQFEQPVINYFTQVSIGTPPKPFNIQFDLDLDELIVPHYSWNPFNRNLHYSNGFQCKVSTSCKKDDQTRTSEYQQCKLTGKKYDDLIGLNHYQTLSGNYSSPHANNNVSSSPSAPLTFSSWRQNFLAISSASDGRFSSLPIDGFFGLSPAPQSPNSVTNILNSLHQAHLIDNLQFSYWFNPILDSPQGGELILGGVDPGRYQGQIYWHHLPNLSSLNQWSLNLQYVSLGHQIISCTGQQCQARFSSGLSDIYGPSEDVEKVYSLLNSTPQSNSRLHLIDCRRISGLPILTFNIDGIPYALLPSNYIRKTTDGVVFKRETCYVAILPSPASGQQSPKQWLLGTNFLGAYYSIFDMTYRQVGFAALR